MVTLPTLPNEILEAAAFQEQAIEDISVSSSPGERGVALVFSIGAASLQGKTILDTAAGCSDFVRWSSEQGATSFGVDPGYRDIPALGEKARESMERNRSRRELEFLGNPSRLAHASMFNDLMVQTLSNFSEDTDENPSRYIAASSSALPFGDNTIDIVVNHSFLTSEAGLHYEFTLVNLFEALRVLKPGGVFHIGPLVKPQTKEEVENFKTIQANIANAAELARRQRIAEGLSKFTRPVGSTIFKVVKATPKRINRTAR